MPVISLPTLFADGVHSVKPLPGVLQPLPSVLGTCKPRFSRVVIKNEESILLGVFFVHDQNTVLNIIYDRLVTMLIGEVPLLIIVILKSTV